MRIEEIDQLEKELTWLFVHIPCDDPVAREQEIQRTIEYLKQLRACAKEELSVRQVQQLGVNCLMCGRALPLARSSKQRFCFPYLSAKLLQEAEASKAATAFEH